MTVAAQSLFGFARPRLAGWPAGFEAAPDAAPKARSRPLTRKERRSRRRAGLLRALARRGTLGFLLIAAVLGGTGLYGAMRSGAYDAFVAENGSPLDLLAKAAGFPIRAVAITGMRVLEPGEILKAAGIDPTHSLLFLNASGVRARLTAVPLVRDAVVTKLFPNRLSLAIEEREPVAVWQKDGHLSIVSADGVAIDDVADDRFIHLPFVVGDGANTHLAEFLALLDKAGDIRGRITAGVRIADRRWDLKIDNGLRVELPEEGAAAAVAQLATLDKSAHLLDKDLVSLDLRMPGRVTVRLSDDAAEARAASLAKKPKAKGTSE